MIDDESGEYVAPAKTYLDDVEVYDAELGGVVPAWKSLIYHGAKARRFAQLTVRADSASAVDAGQAGIEQPPPLVADAIAQAKADVATRIINLLKQLDRRMTALEQQADAEDRQARAAEALTLAEDIAEAAPKALLSALAGRTARLH
jgi:hypothetical protein